MKLQIAFEELELKYYEDIRAGDTFFDPEREKKYFIFEIQYVDYTRYRDGDILIPTVEFAGYVVDLTKDYDGSIYEECEKRFNQASIAIHDILSSNKGV